MEKSELKKDVGAQCVEPLATSRRNLLLAVGVSFLLAFALIALLSRNEPPVRVLEVVKIDEEPEKMMPIAGPPSDEVRLMGYDEFADTYRLAETMSELEFLADMMDIAQHNLATLAGLGTDYRRQSPFKLKLDERFKAYSWSDLPLELLSGQQLPEVEEEGAVSGSPSAELKKTNLVSKWFVGLTKKEADFEIPSFPLDQQPDPERITHIDVDQRACLGSVREQGHCGSCYAFSWLSLVEWHYCKQAQGQVVDFSEQHIVDCGQVAHLNGCVEGKLSNTKDFTQVFGLHWEKEYPYTAKKGACKRQQGDLSVKVVDFRRIKVDRIEFEEVLREQPILLEVRLPADISFYSSGIHPSDNCDLNSGHGMLLVGHGRQEGRPYWLLRDSAGKKWGENGYVRLSRDLPDMKKCFGSAFVAKFKFKNMPQENYDDFYDTLKFEPSLDQDTDKGASLSALLGPH